MVGQDEETIAIGCQVRIRTAGWTGLDRMHTKTEAGVAEHVLAIVHEGEQGVNRLTARTPLGWALLGRRVGDVVPVTVQAGTVMFQVVAIEPPTQARSGLAGDGRVVEVGDVVDIQDGELEEWWRIVSHCDADATRRWISEDSPLGRAILGHRPGDVVRVRAPKSAGPGRPVTILAVRRPGP